MLKNTSEYKRFVWELNNIINLENMENESIIFLCLGTNRVIGDAFGPVVGSALKKVGFKNNKIKIIGDLENVVTYNNINNKIKFINVNYRNSMVIVLDSALSNQSDVGRVFIQNRGLKYAESLRKKNNTVGNISIKAVVGEDSFDVNKNFSNLMDVNIKQIEYVSAIVASGIVEVMNKKENIGKNICK